MKTREFDPVFSAALRTELEDVAEAGAPARGPRAGVLTTARQQILIPAGTALVLLVATLGVLRVAVPPESRPLPAGSGALVEDPLRQIADPDGPDYLGEPPVTLLHQAGTGPARLDLSVPAGVTSVRPVIRCAPDAEFRIAVGKGYSTTCSARTTPGFADIPVSAGRHVVVVTLPAGVEWKLAVVATPGTQVRVPSSTPPSTSWRDPA